MKLKNINIEVVRGDITQLGVDAIVNAARSDLVMEAGLSGFIIKEGGDRIAEEALSKAPVKVGDAVWTSSGNLKSQYVIHAVTVGPDARPDEAIIRSAAASALRCAKELKIRSLAFPALGCGVGGFPAVGTAKIIIQEILRLTRQEEPVHLTDIRFCLYDEQTFEIFNKTVYGYVQHIADKLGPGPYITVDIIIEVQDGIVLIERSNPPYGVALPGGFLDYGESLEQAAKREAKEETNLDIVNLRQFHTYSRPDRDARFHTVSTVFIAQGRGAPRSGDDAAALRIVKYEDLPQLDYAFDHKEIIKEYLIEKEFNDDLF